MSETTPGEEGTVAGDTAVVDRADEAPEPVIEPLPARSRPALRMFEGGEVAHCEGDACLVPVKRG